MNYSPSNIYVSDLIGNITVDEKKVVFTAKSKQVFELKSGKGEKNKEFKIDPEEFKTDDENSSKTQYKYIVAGLVKETKTKDEKGNESVKFIIEVSKLEVIKK